MTTTARILLCIALGLGSIAAGAVAAAAEVVPDSFRRCAGLTDATRRLACFDDAMNKLGVPLAASTTVAPVAVAGRAVPSPEEKFGATGELKEKQEPKPVEPPLTELTAKIKAVRQAASGHYVVTLDNGQVWRQVTPEPMMMKAGEPVTIKPRSLGSFWMIDNSGRGSRVKRIQ